MTFTTHHSPLITHLFIHAELTAVHAAFYLVAATTLASGKCE